MGSPRSGRNVTRPPGSPVQASSNEGEQAFRGDERTEDVLKEGEERYRRLVENLPETIAVLDEEKILFVNAAGARLAGAEDPADLIGKPYLDFVHPDFRDLVKSRVLRAQREGVTAGLVEEKLLRLDGSVVDVEAMVMPITYGGKAATLSVIRDIAGRKRAEEALKESEERYRAVMEQSVETIYLYDAHSKQVLESNKAFQKMMGYSEEELLGLEIYEFIDHERGDIDQNVERSLKEGRRHIGERRYRRKDGSLIVVETSASVISYQGKKALCAVSRDITERKRLEEALRVSETRLRTVIEQSPLAIHIIAPDGGSLLTNVAWEETWNLGEERTLEGENVFEDAKLRAAGLVSYIEESVASGVAVATPPLLYDPVQLRRAGTPRWLRGFVYPVLDGDGRVHELALVLEDITERKQAEEALAEERNLLRTLIDNMPDFIFVKDAESRFVINNVEHARALGAPEEELVGKTDFDVFPRELAERYYADEQEVVKLGRPLIDTEEPITNSDGNDRWLSTTKVPLKDGAGRISGLVGISRDITERKALEEQLRHRAFHDPLTELPNRALLLDRLEHALARSGRLGEPVAVLFVDLDDFKGVNDSLGHEMGDRLLVEVAGRLRSCVRPGDTVARIFGDEFAVLLESPTSIEDARRVTERITEKVRAPFVLDGRELFLSSSVGIVLADPAREDRPESILRRADLAMYAAKSRGKDRSEVFNPSMDIRASERMELENDLRGAIEREEFEIHYQPLVDLRTDGIQGLEALVRWRHPKRGLIDAEEFVWLAEETGLIRTVGRWVFEEACRQAHRWNERLPDNRIIVSVNFSASQFARQADLIPKVLADTGLDPRALAIEITERTMMDDAEFSLGKLRRLKDLGMSLGVDDYGTGYSCLRYLKLMPVDFLKIDRSFIAGLGEDPGDEAIVSGTINLAHALGLRVVAEGVETAGQRSRLEELDCDLGQGLHLYEPLTPDEVSDLLARAQR